MGFPRNVTIVIGIWGIVKNGRSMKVKGKENLAVGVGEDSFIFL